VGIHKTDYAANFNDFLDAAPTSKPWCFWYGCVEPHREYEYGSGVAKGRKKTSDIDHVPGYWPDNETVRNDMLDYAFEVEHFDWHLGRMLAELEKRGMLANTIVVVTSDHAMPFPRVKGNAYEFANHIPLAMMWPEGIAKPGRVVDDFVSFIDLAPTFLELANIPQEKSGMAEITGESLMPILKSEKSGQIIAKRDHVLIGKERTDIGRPHDWGYPTRGIIKDGWLYLKNYEPSRWPAGNPETGYLDCDGGATKTFILDAHRQDRTDRFWQLCFGIRTGEELYDLAADPDCLTNLAAEKRAAARLSELSSTMNAQLSKEGDPRMEGKGDVFDKYEHANKGHVGFYEKFMEGAQLKTRWINETDIDPLEKKPLAP
jgi:arylsulfatase A-like enzyme